LRALDEGADLVLAARPRHALAEQNERPLGLFEQVQRRLDILRRRHHARRFAHAVDLDDLVEVAFGPDDVVGHVEIGGAGAAIERVPRRHLDIIGDAVHALDAVRELAEGRGDHHLPLFLKRTHAAAIGFRSAADQDHGPAILLGIGEAGETMHHARTGHGKAGAGAAGEIAIGARGVGRTLLVAHAEIGDAFFLRRHGNRGDRKSNDPEQVVDALLFQAARKQGRAIDLAHGFPSRFYLSLTARLCIEGGLAKVRSFRRAMRLRAVRPAKQPRQKNSLRKAAVWSEIPTILFVAWR
jgi:hypothetical protein